MRGAHTVLTIAVASMLSGCATELASHSRGCRVSGAGMLLRAMQEAAAEPAATDVQPVRAHAAREEAAARDPKSTP